MKKIYFACPLYCKSDIEYNAKLARVLEENGYTVFLPKRDGSEVASTEDKSESSNEVFRKEISEILKADIFLMVLDGYTRDDAACVELGFSYASGKKCYGINADAHALEFGLEINPMISGCLNTILRIGKGEEALDRLSAYLKSNQL